MATKNYTMKYSNNNTIWFLLTMVLTIASIAHAQSIGAEPSISFPEPNIEFPDVIYVMNTGSGGEPYPDSSHDDIDAPSEPLEAMACNLPFSEGFESSSPWPPSGWSRSSTSYVVRNTSYKRSGSASCRMSGTNWLQMDYDLDVSGCGDFVISTWLYESSGMETTDCLYMYYSTNSGGDWIEWASKCDDLSPLAWTEYNSPTLSGISTLRLRFESTCDLTSEYWYLDDILIAEPDVELTKDGGPIGSYLSIGAALSDVPQTLDGVYVITVNSDRTYSEQVDVFKYNSNPGYSLTIQAGDGYNPIVDGNQYGFYIKPFGSTTDLLNVTIDGFEVISCTNYGFYVDQGGSGDYPEQLTIRNCIIHNTNSYGLYLKYADYCTIINNIIYDTGSSYAIYFYYCDGSAGNYIQFVNNTIYDNSTTSCVYFYNSEYVNIRNNIIWNFASITTDYAIRNYHMDNYVTSYNYYCVSVGATAIDPYDYSIILGTGDKDVISTHSDYPPYFVSTTSGSEDFHLQSAFTGHWDGVGWSSPDPNTSPCIDAGDLADDYSNEPEGNGSRINQGAYGNTTEATRTSIVGAYDEDSEVKVGATAEPATISSLVDTEGEKTFVFDVEFEDKGTSDGESTTILTIKFTQGSANDFADWTQIIAGAHLCGPDLGTDLAGVVSATDITFTIAIPYIVVDDGTSETYQLKIWLKADLPDGADNDNLELKLDYTDITTGGAGSSFGSGSPESGNDKNAIDIQATKIYYDSYPPFYETNTDFTTQVSATDDNGNRDEDHTGNVTLTLYEGTGNLTSVTGLVNKPLASGTYTWSDVKYDGTDSIKIKIERVGGGLTEAISNYIRCLQAGMYFVNDHDLTDDTYCSAEGDSANTGLRPDSPRPKIRDIINNYVLAPGDIIWVDKGTYVHSATTAEFYINSSDDGDTTSYVTFKASPNGVIIDGFTHGVYLYDAKYIIIDGFTFMGTTQNGVYIYRNSDHNKITNCTIYDVGSSYNGIRIYNSSSAKPDSNEICYNEIADGNHGIYVYSSSSSYYCYGNSVHHNEVHDCSYQGIYYYYNRGIEVYNNEVYSCGNSQNSGIYVYYGDDARIYNNELHTGSTSNYGIRISGTDNADIYNNLIYDTSYRGIYNENGSDNNEYYYNSVYAEDYAFNLNAGSNTIIKNNIFWATGSGTGGVALYSNVAATEFTSDNNDLYAPDGRVGRVPFTYYTTLTDWQSATSEDANSISRNPLFENITPGSEDLHLQDTSPCIDSGTIVLSGFETDFDGDTRNPPTDIGADEKPPAGSANDAGITSITAPVLTFCPGTEDVEVTLQNYGSAVLNSVKIKWAVDEGSGYVEQTPYIWTGPPLNPYASQENIDIGDFVFASGVVCSLKVWTTDPNGAADENESNDTSDVNYIGAGFTGTFTIGGSPTPSYPNFTQAVTALMQFNICGPVTFNVRDGTYDEQIVLQDLDGSSATNIVTFQSQEGDSHLVILRQGIADGPSNNYTVKLDGADYFIFQKMTLQATGATSASYTTVIEIDDSSCNNQFLNNQLFGHSQTGFLISLSKAIVYSNDAETSMDNDNVFRNNWFKDGSYGMYYQGYTHELEEWRESGTVVENNTFENSFYGIYIANQDDLTINGNYIINGTVSNIHNYGIYLLHCYNEFEMIGNRIIMDNTGNQHGIYMISCDGNDDGGEHIGIIANNMVAVGGGSELGGTTSEGYYSNGTTYKKFYYNTFNSNGAHTSGGSKGFYINGPSDGHNTLRNNIFSCLNGTHIYNSISSAIDSSDYNDYYSEAPDPDRWGYWGNQVYDLSDIQTASGDDDSSMTVDPDYVDPFATAKDLHIKPTSPVIEQGTTLVEITEDIDEDMRDDTTPDIGADENGPNKIWTGNVSTDWDTDNNWNPIGVPIYSDFVGIPADPESNPDRWPTRTGNLTIEGSPGDQCMAISMKGASELTVTGNMSINTNGAFLCTSSGNQMLILQGDWTNEGTFRGGGSTVTFDGSAPVGDPQLICGSSTTTFNILEIKDSSVKLNSDAINLEWDVKIIITETTGDAKLILPAVDGGEPNMEDATP